ncbi:hypothetical protein [Azospirillum sp.]|uniref:hypothetical protein n=1 Tax=Azospirillum sp. TaxID=34012 RepID=UPI002D5E72A5|nr:hypothetical protein [Azospirillum sp.]HYF88978.1 hypothetical protein [Azospirillum sp.]
MYEKMLQPAAHARLSVDIFVMSASEIAAVKAAAFKVATAENCNVQVDESDRDKVRVIFTSHPSQWP